MAPKTKTNEAAPSLILKQTMQNFTWEDPTVGAGIVTDSGMWSPTNSIVEEGPKKGQVAPFDAWLYGIKMMTTNGDKTRARDEAVKLALKMSLNPEEEAAKAIAALKDKLYFSWFLEDKAADRINGTIVVKGDAKKVQHEGKILSFSNLQAKEFLLPYVATMPDPRGEEYPLVTKKNIYRFQVFATGVEKVSGGAHTMHNFRFVPKGMMLLSDFEEQKIRGAFAGLLGSGEDAAPQLSAGEAS